MSRDDLTTFLRAILPDQRTWQTFDDKRAASGRPRRDRRLARVLHGSLDGVESTLSWLNTPEVGAGVYISGNHTDGTGRATRNIKRIVTVVADLDHGLPPTLPLPPTLIIETSPSKFQAWWSLADEDALTHDEHHNTRALDELGRRLLEALILDPDVPEHLKENAVSPAERDWRHSTSRRADFRRRARMTLVVPRGLGTHQPRFPRRSFSTRPSGTLNAIS